MKGRFENEVRAASKNPTENRIVAACKWSKDRRSSPRGSHSHVRGAHDVRQEPKPVLS